MRGFLVALISASALPAYADSCVWYADDDSIRQVRASDNQVARSVALREPHRLVMNAQDCGVWTLDKHDRKILRFDAEGRLERVIPVRNLDAGLGEVERLHLDPYDGSLWVADDRRIAHLSAQGEVLASFSAPGEVRRMDVALDRTIWVLGRRELWRFDAKGTLLARHYLGQHLAGDARYFALDSLEGSVWIADDDDLALLKLSAPGEVTVRVRLHGELNGFALDPLTGNVWVALRDSLRAFSRAGAALHNINLEAHGVRRPEKLAFDPVARALWVGAERSVSRFTDSGQFVAKFRARDGDEALGVPALVVRPTLTLIQPPRDGLISNPRPEFRLAYSVECNGVSCELPASHLGGYLLTATLNAQPVGPAFQFDPQAREARFTPAERLPEGQNSFEARVKDRFGNESSAVTSAFTVDTVPPQFLTLSPANGTVMQTPFAVLQGTIDSVGTVVLEGGAAATQPGPAFSFPVTLNSGVNVFFLSAIDPAGNRTTIQHTLFFVPLALGITAPVNGATISGSSAQVSGTLQGPLNTGVTVNGVVAALSGDRYFATVPLQPGLNVLTVSARTQDGFVSQQSVTVTSTPAPIEIGASPQAGLAPLTVTFVLNAALTVPISRIQADFDGNGTIDFTAFNRTTPVTFTYTQPGVYSARLLVLSAGVETTHVVQVVVQDPNQLDAQLRAVWGGFVSKLITRDKAAALTYMTVDAGNRYGRAFDSLQGSLPSIGASLSAIQPATLADAVSEYVVTRSRPDGTLRLFLIYFLVDQDGVWRIDSM